MAWWLAILTIGPLLGSFITEPAAMTICALLLARRFYALNPGAGSIGRVTMKPAAQMIVDAAVRHLVERQRHDSESLLITEPFPRSQQDA